MSSQEEDFNESETQSSKKRRVQRACDVCRRKKIRCDGGAMPNNRCSNCVTYNYECTYIEAAKKRGPPKGYVESLENRLENMEALLTKLCPDADFSKELGGHFDKEAWLDKTGERLYRTQPLPSTSAAGAGIGGLVIAPTDPEDLEPSDDEMLIQHTLAHGLRNMQMNPNNVRFFGKSSSIMFIRTAMDLKHEYAGLDPPTPNKDPGPTLTHRRPGYWNPQPWLMSTVDQDLPPHQNFPEKDLMRLLTDMYFMYVNEYTPLLHRPTFDEGIESGLHLVDEGFGSTVLLVCAVGARFTRDPRVYLDEYSSTHTCGWKWFQQVQMIRKSLLAPPRLYDLQIYCLAATFLLGTSAPQACWTIIGVGVRLAQDVGAHRRKVYTSVPTVEEELWKRAFWVLVSMDRTISAALGRPCAIQDEDFDLDLPMECDDEYWTHPDPNMRFKQPPDKPSTVTFFNCYLRLHQILAFALRTIYSINKSKALLGFVGQQWEQHIVAELDSALNKWIDSVPDHLRWDPNREDLVHLNQSANLYASYYQLQIAVHRPFIPSPRKPSPLSFPSLAICTNAARSCTHVLDIQYKRTGMVVYSNQMALFTAGIVLLLNIWGGKRSGIATEPAKEMADVHKCMKMLKMLEPQWHTAGRLWDILYELASVGDLPLPQPTPPSHKRDRDSDSPLPSAGSAGQSSAAGAGADGNARAIAGSRRVGKDAAATSPGFGRAHVPPAAPDSPMGGAGLHGVLGAGAFALPIHSDELGRLPLHPGFSMPGSSSAGAGAGGGSWFAAGGGGAEALPRAGEEMQAQMGMPSMFALGQGRGAAAPGAVYDELLATIQGGMAPPQQQQQQQQPAGYGAGGGGGGGGGGGEPSYADNTLAMWSAAPSGFEWDDWGTYISSVSGMQQGAGPRGGGEV